MEKFVANINQAKAWPFVEAKNLLKKLNGHPPKKGYVLFETGYGPSGLPHIGTFGEVARTSMVRHAFSVMSDIPTKLFVFSDDMDALRKVPGNVPNQHMLAEHIGKPLTQVPDPFEKYESFGEHNNVRLRSFLDSFGFSYEFKSATECYTSGLFDNALLNVLSKYESVMNLILPTLGGERSQSYSPFLPISPKTGRVLFVPILETDNNNGTIKFKNEDGNLTEIPVTGGRVKLQWKPDWGMRWHVLGVDYEMYGKDLVPSAQLAKQICMLLGSNAPAGFNYELFLDEQGQKISKTKGNGLTIEQWLRYAPAESLSYYMFQRPRTSKRLYWDVIPKAVDEYIASVEKYNDQDSEARIENPAWHIHAGAPPAIGELGAFSFSTLLNIASASHAKDKDALWGVIRNYDKASTPDNAPILDRMAEHAVAYYHDFVRPTNRYRLPNKMELEALDDLGQALLEIAPSATAEEIQSEVYAVGKRHSFPDLKSWFQSLYEVLFGQSTGPRMGSFIKIYGVENTQRLIQKAVTGELVAENRQVGEKNAEALVPERPLRKSGDNAPVIGMSKAEP